MPVIMARPIKKLVIYCDSAASTRPGTWSVKLGIEDPETKKVNYIKEGGKDAHFDLVDPWDKLLYDQEMVPESIGSKSRVSFDRHCAEIKLLTGPFPETQKQRCIPEVTRLRQEIV